MIDWSSVKRIHLIGVAGTGMGSFAGMLKAAGYEVTGSDENVYPPMSTQLERWGIDVLTPYRAENLDRARPDVVVVGNVVREVNPEATAMRERGLPHVSFPAALGELFIGPRHGVVVVGTHGKTTTSAMMGALLHHAGRDPSFLVGGVTRDFESNFRLGHGPHFVVEGDEYDTAYFDKGPKFLHYRPRTAIFTSCELDHADIYRDEAHYETAFERFVDLLPPDGLLAACASYDSVLRIARRSRARVETYAVDRPGADWEARGLRLAPDGARFTLVRGGHPLADVHLPVGGAHNVENALGVAAAATALGLSPAEIASGLESFRGVKRRQEVRGNAGGVVVMDDFAHHPRAVEKTLAAVRGTYPGARLLAAFEPRSNTSRRNLHQKDYAAAATWGPAAEVFLLRPAPTDRVPESERLDLDAVTGALVRAGKPARVFASVDEMVPAIAGAARPGDVVVAMSNGAFGGIWGKLLDALAPRDRARAVAPAPRPPSLGLRHAALRVRDLRAAEDFFVRALGYEVEWRPDPENVYLRRDADDIALHHAADAAGPGLLDHLGIFVARAEDVDAWERHLDGIGARIVARPHTHRDGARSLYVAGPEGIVVQVLHHPRALGLLTPAPSPQGRGEG